METNNKPERSHVPDFPKGLKDKNAASEFLGVSTRAVDMLASDNLIQRYRLGGKTLFATAELIDYLEHNCVLGGAGIKKKTTVD